AELDPESILAVVPTSGSSGRAKGVALSRRAFEAAAEAHARHLGWADEDRWLLTLPLAHVGGLSILTRCLWARRTVVLAADRSFEPSEVLRRLERRRVSLLSAVPTMLRGLMRSGSPPAALRAVLVGGAAVPAELLREARVAGWPALATYGLTEACAQVATQPLNDLEAPERPVEGAPLLHGVEARLASDGALALRGPQLLTGYVGEGLEEGAGAGKDGWFKTGDLATWTAEGRLKILGRRDRVVITGGENVQPADVERALAALPAVAEACVVGLADERWGQRVAAAVVPSTEQGVRDGALDLARVRAELEDRLADFERPRQILIVPSLPRTASGKVDAGAVTRLFET
ncbi:MAG: AMP-binding protein, partial [Acidobacteriota bacterium]